MARKDEEVCKQIFGEYLQAFFGPTEVRWIDGDDPPDFYLELTSKEFAVEVTSLDQPVFTVYESIKGLVDDVVEEAKRDGFLNGLYLVTHNAPFKNFRRTKPKLKTGLLEYLRDTQALSKAPEKVLHEQGGERCAIVKGSN